MPRGPWTPQTQPRTPVYHTGPQGNTLPLTRPTTTNTKREQRKARQLPANVANAKVYPSSPSNNVLIETFKANLIQSL